VENKADFFWCFLIRVLIVRSVVTDAPPDDPITQPTNRGNKLRANAKYVREGAMGYINAEDFYKEVRAIGLSLLPLRAFYVLGPRPLWRFCQRGKHNELTPNFFVACQQKIEHAGYTRYILQRNPIRYDSEGEELDDDDEDSEADAAAAEENPFSGIALESQ